MDKTQRPLYEIKADLFKGLAHPYRIRVLELLAAAQEVCVADMLLDMQIEASHLSQHLAVLRRYRLVVAERRGSNVYYRLASSHAATMLTAARQLLIDLFEENAAQLKQPDSLSGRSASSEDLR
ncbi:transcriptional regulator, ArsR family [Micrococcales bacterium KH10]|nr:transcriptional regulator, ArsR family [Micrococcales bacterium KH10]